MNLKTKLEMITYDLAEFDELSLETQILREAQFRSEKRTADDASEIEALRDEKRALERKALATEKAHAEEVERVYRDALTADHEKEDNREEIAALKERVADLEESLRLAKDESRHLGTRLASSVARTIARTASLTVEAG